jgi:isopenicillin-N N-acyltransferase-like protein
MSESPRAPFPHVRVRGDYRERGRQYGEQAHDRVQVSLAAYERVFAHYAGWDWSKVRREAARHVPAIEALESGYLEEMRGIAAGAGVEFEDILALNVRTEVMLAAKARQALGQANAPGECSSFFLMPQVTASGHTLLGQNWDWLAHCYDSVVVLEVAQQGKPDFVTVVEAGLLCKVALNSSGVGLATNTLVTADDRGEEGIPYHVVLRAIIDCDSLNEVLATVQRMVRSSSANYLVAHRDGVGINLETAAGDFTGVYFLLPERGVILHTNHFLSPRFERTEVSLWVMPDSAVRLARCRAALESARRPFELQDIRRMLSDHADYPNGVCAHPDERDHPQERGATIASLIMDLDEQRLWLADGNPCETPYRELDYSEFLAKGSPVRPAKQSE